MAHSRHADTRAPWAVSVSLDKLGSNDHPLEMEKRLATLMKSWSPVHLTSCCRSWPSKMLRISKMQWPMKEFSSHFSNNSENLKEKCTVSDFITNCHRVGKSATFFFFSSQIMVGELYHFFYMESKYFYCSYQTFDSFWIPMIKGRCIKWLLF